MPRCDEIVHGNHWCARKPGHEGDCKCHWQMVGEEA